jgi:hypothetical protein
MWIWAAACDSPSRCSAPKETRSVPDHSVFRSRGGPPPCCQSPAARADGPASSSCLRPSSEDIPASPTPRSYWSKGLCLLSGVLPSLPLPPPCSPRPGPVTAVFWRPRGIPRNGGSDGRFSLSCSSSRSASAHHPTSLHPFALAHQSLPPIAPSCRISRPRPSP